MLTERSSTLDEIGERLGRPLNETELEFYGRRVLNSDAVLLNLMPDRLPRGLTPSYTLKHAQQVWEAIQTYDPEVRKVYDTIVAVMAEESFATSIQYRLRASA